MPFISKDVIDDIKFRSSIEDVVSEYVTLKRAGSNLVGLCPFHSEKTPSFTVFPSEGNFYCFGCGAGGDIFTFVRKAEALDYPSAVEVLAKRAGITIEHDDSEKLEAARRMRTIAMNTDAAKFFNNCLLNEEEGRAGLDYLQKRGLSMPLIKHFGLGFAADSFGKLTAYLSKRGYTDYEMTDGFLCGRSKTTGKPYDYFRNRVIFPIIGVTGDVIAFGGRVMDDSLPKYLNSSDTPAFKKSRNLFALNFAKKCCGEQMILCEGYMDVIALHGAGFENAVATLGTAITPEQARIMKRYTKSVVISYDSDAAGQNAADKAFRLLGEVGLETRLLKVTDAKDPDEFIKKFGADRFAGLLRNTKGEFDFKFGNILAKYDIGKLEEKIKVLDEMKAFVATVDSAVSRELYINTISANMNISAESIRHDVEKLIKKKRYSEKREQTQRIMTQAQGIGDRVNPDYAKNPRAAAAEEEILGILLLHPEFFTELEKKGTTLSEDDFFTAFSKKVFGAIKQLDCATLELAQLGEFLTVDEMSRLTALSMSRSKLAQNTVEILAECITVLKNAQLSKELSTEDIIKQKRNKGKE